MWIWKILCSAVLVNFIEAAKDNEVYYPCHVDLPVTEDTALCHYMTVNPVPRDCMDIQRYGATDSGVYKVFVGDILKPVDVYCDLETEGGAWLVFQRRVDGSEDFYRGWDDYSSGFGSLLGEFWLGNKHLHAITTQRDYTLRFDLEDFENETRYAEYRSFAIGGEWDNFTLSTLGAYRGTAGDGLSRGTGHMFSTKDRENDVWSGNCAQHFKGAWWYGACHHANLNGLYLEGSHTSYADGVDWFYWHGYHYSLKFTEMKIRPYNFY